MFKRLIAPLALALCLIGLAPAGRAAPAAAPATILTIDGARLAINGKPTFLIGISYYAGLGLSEDQMRRDLDTLKKAGFNWLRIWATWDGFDNDVSAVEADGAPRPQFMKKLVTLVAEADARGFIIDVTFSRGETIHKKARIQTVEHHTRAALAVADALAAHRNWYLDLSNERNIGDRRHASFEDLAAIRAAVAQRHPRLLMTASQGGDISKDELRKYLQIARVDFICPHRPRHKESPDQTARVTKELFDWMKELGRTVPVHYQEPFRRGYEAHQPDLDMFMKDLDESRKSGAAGWCLHNGSTRGVKDGRPRRSFDMRDDVNIIDRLDDIERQVVKRITEQTINQP